MEMLSKVPMPEQPPPSGLDVHLGYLLRRVSNEVSATFARALQAEGVSVAEWVALRLIRDRDHITSGQLAETAAMTRGAMSKVLEKLEGKALVVRTPHPTDSRVQWLALTRKGARLLPRLTAIADGNDEHFFSCLEVEERAALGGLLEKLTNFHQLRGVPVE